MRRGPDAAALLQRALFRQAAASGVILTVETAEARRWASATFTGARHKLHLSGPHSHAFDQWLAELPEAEFALGEHLVADVVVIAQQISGVTMAAEIEALTVEER